MDPEKVGDPDWVWSASPSGDYLRRSSELDATKLDWKHCRTMEFEENSIPSRLEEFDSDQEQAGDVLCLPHEVECR